MRDGMFRVRGMDILLTLSWVGMFWSCVCGDGSACGGVHVYCWLAHVLQRFYFAYWRSGDWAGPGGAQCVLGSHLFLLFW